MYANKLKNWIIEQIEGEIQYQELCEESEGIDENIMTCTKLINHINHFEEVD